MTAPAPRPAPRLAPHHQARLDEQRRIEALGEEITTLAAHLNAAMAHFIALLAEFDRAQGWVGEGVSSLAHWLNWRCGIGIVAARERVRVARALAGLPQLQAAFGCGELSYSKVRAATRIATRENEDYLLMIARHGTAAHLEWLVRSYRRVVSAEADREAGSAAHGRRYLEALWTQDEEPRWRLKGALGAEQGALVEQALEGLMTVLEAEEETREDDSLEAGIPAASQADDDSAEARRAYRDAADTEAANARLAAAERRPRLRADALVRMAEITLERLAHPDGAAARAVPPRAELVVHVDAELLARTAPEGWLGRCAVDSASGRPRTLPVETVRRLGCDAARVTIIEGADGSPLSVGRRTRTVPPAIRRALEARDGRCRFPGCCRRAGLDAHHVQHWADGGETSLDNLIQLCRTCHRRIHEEGFRVEATAQGGFRFRRPDGRILPEHPKPVAGERAALVAAHRTRGLAIDARTAVPDWHGEAMDRSWAVEILQLRATSP